MTFIVSIYRRSPTLTPSEAFLEDLENSRRAICQASRLRVHRALLRSHGPRRDRAAHPLSRRRSAGRRSRAAHAWRAVVVAPLSPDNREPRRARSSRGRAGPGGLRPFGQTCRSIRLHLRAARAMDERLAGCHAPVRYYALLPGLGRPYWASAGGCVSREIRARGGRQ